MKQSSTHKHIWYRGRVFNADWYDNRWNCDGIGWATTPREAVIERTLSNTYDHEDQPKTVRELHELEEVGR